MLSKHFKKWQNHLWNQNFNKKSVTIWFFVATNGIEQNPAQRRAHARRNLPPWARRPRRRRRWFCHNYNQIIFGFKQFDSSNKMIFWPRIADVWLRFGEWLIFGLEVLDGLKSGHVWTTVLNKVSPLSVGSDMLIYYLGPLLDYLLTETQLFAGE